jgi:DNA-binding LacI/PurR family transcriptional regulator
VHAQLMQRIGTQWPTGSSMPPLRELSRDLGVAYGTLRGAVRSLVEAGYLTCKPRQGIVVLRGPQASNDHVAPDVLWSTLRGKTIDLLFSFGDASFVPDMVRAFSERAQRAGALVRTRLVPDLDGVERQQRIALGDFSRSDADGVVAFNAQVPLTPRPGCPLVMLSTAVEVEWEISAMQGYDVVTVDSAQGARLAADWLRQCGCQRPAFLGVARPDGKSLNWSPTSTARYQAFARNFASPPPMLHATAYSVRLAGETVDAFLQLSPQPDGLFAASDELAVGFLLGAQARGFPVHDRLHVVGFDGQHRARALCFKQFATVAVATQQMGVTAAELLASRLADPNLAVRRVHVGCSLLPLGPSAAASVTGGVS